MVLLVWDMVSDWFSEDAIDISIIIGIGKVFVSLLLEGDCIHSNLYLGTSTI